MARQHRRKGMLSGVLARILPPVMFLPAMMSHGVAAAQEAGEPAQAVATVVAAVWKPQEISFYFHSFNTFYPCPSLNDKVRRLLLQLGADRDIRVRSTGCDIGYAVARSPMVRIKLSAPAEATPETLAELEKTRTTRELVARVRGGETMDVAAQFPAYWRRVALDRGIRNLDSGDCELIDAIKRQVLPQLAVRIVRDNMRCGPYQYSSAPVPLEVEALVAVPAADAVTKREAS
jgi:hypothetical protein